jgi:hypothetical protein
MAIFCTQCGTKNEDGAAFCESCGTRLLKAAAPETQAPAPTTSAPSVDKPASTAAGDAAQQAGAKLKALAGSKTLWYAVGGVVSLLAVGGVVAYFVLSPPAATPDKLLAAAKEGYGKAISVQYKRELCLSNMNYGLSDFNVGERDQGTQAWLNALVSAGLYSPAVPISSGGYFPETLLQYVATPELAKWRDGARLCLAKDVNITEVIEIEKPQEETVGRNAKGNPAKLLTVKAKLVLQSTETAPWLGKPEIQTEALGMINGWDYKNAQLQKQIPDTFGLREGQWATGPAYKASIQKQYQSSQRRNNNDEDETIDQGDKKGFFAGLGSKLSGLFSFGGHPLKGTWKMDTQAMGNLFGTRMPSGLGLDATMTFTSDSLEVAGQSIKCKFEVDGKRVKVIPEGQAASLIFIMEDKDTASIDMGIMKMKYKRTE